MKRTWAIAVLLMSACGVTSEVGAHSSAVGVGDYVAEALPLLYEGPTSTTGINLRGEISGTAIDEFGHERPLLWHDGTVEDIGPFGSLIASTVAINLVGDVTGNFINSDTGEAHAFRWRRGVNTDLGTLGGSGSSATAINTLGQVVGVSSIALDQPEHAFLWRPSGMVNLGSLGGPLSMALAINERGQVVGFSQDENQAAHAVLWDGGPPIDLGLGRASDINAAGAIVGQLGLHAFLRSAGVTIDLGTLGGVASGALRINNVGQVMGMSRTSDNAQHGFFWERGVMVDLGTLGGHQTRGPDTNPIALNNRGQVVGQSRTPTDGFHAFVWQNGVMTDFGPGVAVDINDLGEIVGTTPTGPVVWRR